MSHSSQLFNSLATEVLDHICSFIPSPRDLLSFALCQRRLSAIIVPSHIQFRDLVLSLSHRSLIRKLPERPLLASRFVSLEYASNSKSFIWPASLLKNLSAEWPVMGKGDQRRILDEVSKELVPGIQCLVGLTSFRCDLHATGMADPIFTALQESCPALTTLELVYSSYSGPSRSTVWDFSNLTRFSCTLWGPFYDDEHTKRAFMMLTDRCPRLEELQFSHTSVLDITALAETGRWPHLRSLALGAMGDSATITLTNPILNEFIKAQPRLERLYVNCSGTPLLVHDLPSLRSLHLGLGVTINKKKKFPVSKTLEFLAIDFICDFEGYIHFLKQRPPLRALVVAPDQIRRVSDFIKTFVHFVPDLEKFHWNQEIKDSCTHNHDVGAICQVLTHLPRLTHLSNVLETKADYGAKSFDRELNLALARLAKAAPSLRFLDVGSTKVWRTRRWLVIERGRGGRYSGYRWLQKHELKYMGVIAEDWGGFYFGTGKGSMYMRGWE